MAGDIDLSDIAGDDHFAFVAEAGEEHHHLLWRGVLSFVEDYEGVVEGAAAHVSEGGDFYDAFFDEFLDVCTVEHVVKGIVEGAEVGENLFLKVPWEETEAFAGFNCGATEDNAFDRSVEELGDGGGHCEVGFTCAGGADSEDDVVF